MRRFTKYETFLVVLFILSLTLCNPWVRGDGIGYYAYVRSMVIEGHLNFEKDWQHGNDSFVMGRIDPDGHVVASQYTRTGHLGNIWTVGPAILWAPFMMATHAGVLAADRMGAHVAADGFSRPYLITMAVATAFYGFLGVLFSFGLARKYCHERWAFLAALGIWWASSLPVYMYFNPSWSHAHSAFVNSLFLWYWDRTRERRTVGQWILLGLISGLMVDVYYPNGVLLLIPLAEAAVRYWRMLRAPGEGSAGFARLFLTHVLYVCVFTIGLLPTFISRQIIFGGPLKTGYDPVQKWAWTSPAFLKVLVSSDHGLLSWTPILALALVGLFLFRRTDRLFANYLMMAATAYYLVIALHTNWDGISSFGNRFFVSLTPLFVLGLAAFFDALARAWQERRAAMVAFPATALLVLWNLGLMFQWGIHLIPVRGPISWRVAAYNQVAVVPGHILQPLQRYFVGRKELMKTIERADVKQLKSQQHGGAE